RLQRESETVHETEVLRRTDVEFVHIRETNAADLVEHHVIDSVVDGDLIAPHFRISLAGGETRAEAEVERELIETGHIGRPPRVDEDVLERAAARRTFHDRSVAETET